jgi:hypothetical protein
MKCVLDASVALKWALNEPDAAKARQRRDDFQIAVHQLIAPDSFTPEIAHALTGTQRGNTKRRYQKDEPGRVQPRSIDTLKEGLLRWLNLYYRMDSGNVSNRSCHHPNRDGFAIPVENQSTIARR